MSSKAKQKKATENTKKTPMDKGNIDDTEVWRHAGEQRRQKYKCNKYRDRMLRTELRNYDGPGMGPGIPLLRRQSQEHQKFKFCLGYKGN